MTHSDPDDRRMKVFPGAEVVNGAIVTRSILPFHEAAQNPPILLETALKQDPEPKESLYPLVLYIARVAGSNNIILSNLKPGQNSVTRTDVENSLYFVQQLDPAEPLFAASPTDTESIMSNAVSARDLKDSPVKTTFLPPPPLQEHPIFRHTSQSASHVPESLPSASVPAPPSSLPPPIVGGIRRKPVPPDLETRRLSALSTLDHPPATKKPDPEPDVRPSVSPYLREIMEAGALRKGTTSNAAASHSNMSRLPSPPQTESLPLMSSARLNLPASRPRSSGRPSSPHVHLSSSGYPTPRPTPSPSASPRNSILPPINTNVAGTVTLPKPIDMALRIVRWHHSTSQTWPVAHLISAPLPASTKEMRRRSFAAATISAPIPPVRIILENPGYVAFADTPGQVFHQRDENTSLPMLVRDVDMAYEKSWTKRLLQHSRGKKSEGGNGGIASAFGRGSHSRSTSSDEDASINLAAGPGLKKEGYTFVTPWGTRCFFRTGKAGASLVCYHSVPVQQSRARSRSRSSHSHPHSHSHSRNSMASGFSSPEKEEKKRFREIPVSELRFNLPGMSLFGNSPNEGQGHGTTAWDVPNWLGKEKAGGGRHGDHAKMGKLIILEGGKDMVDLVVAANVGIWWRSWNVTH
ncbi:uncharacterized protein BROUX77_006141 [Berkeleyomyces rouxiae]|uniref:uncharacterized protein n=1 Tax=Berkeleyomyces rouxiae TaxID=2035830 RepID=UPI003B80025A